MAKPTFLFELDVISNFCFKLKFLLRQRKKEKDNPHEREREERGEERERENYGKSHVPFLRDRKGKI